MFKYLKRKIEISHFHKKAPRAFESFYHVTNASKAFLKYCQEVHDLDFPVQNNMSPLQKDRVLDIISDWSPKSILDIGCGPGHFSNYLAQTLKCPVHGIDFIENTNDQINYTKANIENIDLTNKKYDFIISIDSLYMIDNMKKLIKKIYNSLAPKGNFLTLYTSTTPIEKIPFIKILNKLKIKYTAIDFTHNDYLFWHFSKNSINNFNELFHNEGSAFIWKTKQNEIIKNLKLHEKNEMFRYLIYFSKEDKHD